MLVGSPVARFGVAAALMLLLGPVVARRSSWEQRCCCRGNRALPPARRLIVPRPCPTDRSQRCRSLATAWPARAISDPPAGVVLRAVRRRGAAAQPGYGRTQRQSKQVESGITARRLSPSGMALLTGTIEQGAFGAGCNDRYVDRPTVTVTLRSADGRVAGARWYTDRRRRPEDDPGRARRRCRPRELLDLDGWLPAGAWRDAVERPYARQSRWELNVQQSDTESLGRGDVDPRVGTAGMTLPDGRSSLDLGEPLPPTAQADAGIAEVHGRCAVVDPASRVHPAGVQGERSAGLQPALVVHGCGRSAQPTPPGADGCRALPAR